MTLITTKTNGSRKFEIYQLNNGKYETFCMVGDSMSYGSPAKTYKSEKAANTYGEKFLNK